MENYYFTFWIAKHGKDTFIKLSNKVLEKTTLPDILKGKVNKDEYAFHYFWAVYCIVALNYFGLSENQIAFFLDLSMTTGLSKLYPPKEILKTQKDNIPEIVKFIKEDLKEYGGE